MTSRKRLEHDVLASKRDWLNPGHVIPAGDSGEFPKHGGSPHACSILPGRQAELAGVFAGELGGALVADRERDGRHIAGFGEQPLARVLEPHLLLVLNRTSPAVLSATTRCSTDTSPA